jgi:hypothetical protein
LLVLALSLFACSEVINLDVDQGGGDLVIFGRITNGTQGNQVLVARTAEVGAPQEMISGAVVKIIDENGNEATLAEDARNPGVYQLDQQSLQGTVGTAYRLEVEVLGSSYQTALQRMPELLGRDEVEWEYREETDISDAGVAFTRNVINVYNSTTFDELPEEFYVRWNIEEVYTVLAMDLPRSWYPRYSPMQCYINNNLSEQETFLLDGTEIRNQNLGRRLFAKRDIDRSFAVKHYFNVIQSAINKETHEYWSRVNSITTRQGSIFDTPPASVPGNIFSDDPNETVLGYFEVVAVDTARTFLTNNDILVFWDDPCELRGEERVPLFTVPMECINCLIEEKIVEETCIFCNKLTNSSTQRPSYF